MRVGTTLLYAPSLIRPGRVRSLRLQSVTKSFCSMASSSAPSAAKRKRASTTPPSNKRRAPEDSVAFKILQAEKTMSDELEKLKFASPVTHVYNPLEYAWEAHRWFVEKYGNSRRKVLLVGMNPGPWGMAQTGVPFGEVEAVKNWLKMPADIEIRKPPKEHPKREVLGLSTERSEVSGKRLWQEWAQATYDTPEKFFDGMFFVHNYCPLMFLEASGRNRTPDKLPVAKRKRILEICDAALVEIIAAIQPSLCAGVGGFAAKRIEKALQESGKHIDVRVGTLLHPSPASPLANGGKWVGTFTRQLDELLQKITESATDAQDGKEDDIDVAISQ